MRWAAIVAMVGSLAGGTVSAPASTPEPDVVHAFAPEMRALETTSATQEDVPWAQKLAAVHVSNKNTTATDDLRLYRDDGTFDPAAAKAFMKVASRSEGETLDVRLVRLVFRASYHFGGAPVVIVSGTRRGARGRHGSGEALDFALDGVSAGQLAAHLRTLPRAGVGIYTHPKTQYVHLDVRDHSYHWIDASPPGVTWREQLLPDPKQAERDASWLAAGDLPEAAR
jgi:uncharacterized protein YcbK (DUF882 family)